MCSNFHQMENYGGDLADIIRTTGGAMKGSIESNIPCKEVSAISDHCPFQNHQIEYGSGVEESLDEFGDPFSNLQDPLFHDMETQGSSFFSNCSDTCTDKLSSSVENPRGFGGGGGDQSFLGPKIGEGGSNDNFLATMTQISPKTKLSTAPRGSQVIGACAKSPMLPVNDVITSSKCENAGVQIPTPRNAGIKRRKSQAKKVVCIPAPAPANSRPSGEVVPSDLWAWRKYGQKPIKGSPYPRGYYRCSSSKGCPARKQVERSRTDPNMLVITYTCEHNHPWPTQRNALAGSTRTQPSKSGSSSKTPSTPPQSHKAATHFKQEQMDPTTQPHDNNGSSSILTGNSSTGPSSSVKEETEDLEKGMEMEDAEFSEVFPQSYKPALPVTNYSEDFFAVLRELEADPMNLLFPDGYSDVEGCENKSLDPFAFYEWAGNNNNCSSNLLGEDKKGS